MPRVSDFELHFTPISSDPVSDRVVDSLLEDGFDVGVQRNVRLREAIDAITLAGGPGSRGLQREMEKAADVIVLVEDAKEAFGFLWGEPKSS